VSVAPGAAGTAPACSWPATATIAVDAGLIADPTIANPRRPGHKQHVPVAYGALLHEIAHVNHSHWTPPDGTPPVVAAVADLLEESRAEGRHRTRRPRDRRWLRHAVTTLVDPGDAPTDSRWDAGYAAGLLLARVDARVLYPRDVATLRRAVTNVLGRTTLRALRDIWRQAHTVGDTDTAAMLDLAWRWCHLLGVDPATTPLVPASAATAATGRVAAAVAAVLAHLAADAGAAGPPDGTSRPGGPDRHVDTGLPITWTRRPPTDAERHAAARLGAALRRARTREPASTTSPAATPPGRLRTRAAMQAAAQRSAGTIPTAQPWRRTTRRLTADPDLALAVLVDVSGSMHAFAAPLSAAAWILAHAGTRAGASVATIAFGDRVTVLVPPGHRPGQVCDMRADAGTEQFDQAVAEADRLLHLSSPGTARLAVVVSDGWFEDRTAAQHTLTRLRDTGCAVLWLAPANRPSHTYHGVATVAVDDPATCITHIARAATDALTHA